MNDSGWGEVAMKLRYRVVTFVAFICDLFHKNRIYNRAGDGDETIEFSSLGIENRARMVVRVVNGYFSFELVKQFLVASGVVIVDDIVQHSVGNKSGGR